jgi:AcrR family transcriptional regulator
MTARASLDPGERINRRDDIIAAAGRLFRQKGYAATTVRDIAAACRMQGGSPFYHFASKAEILQAIMLRGVTQATDRLREAIAAHRDGDPRRLFARMVRVHLDSILDDDANFVPALLYEWRSLTDDLRSAVVAEKDAYEALWAQELEALERRNLLRRADSLNRLLLLGMLNFMVQWYSPSGVQSLDAIVERVVETWLVPVPAEAGDRP